MSTRALYESLSFIGSTWPKDALRLDVNFGQSVITAAERCLAAEALASPPPQTSSSQGVKTRIDTKSIQFRDLGKEEVKMTENAVNALQAIKEGRASTQVRNGSLSVYTPLPLLSPPTNDSSSFINLFHSTQCQLRLLDLRLIQNTTSDWARCSNRLQGEKRWKLHGVNGFVSSLI
jgi:hypothetical protein